MRALPLRFQPAYERTDESTERIERTVGCALETIMREFRRFADRRSGRHQHTAHAARCGLLRGELQVFGDLPLQLAQGVFAIPQTCPLVMRLATTSGDCRGEAMAAARGMAIRIFEVEGPCLSESASGTQDFLFADRPGSLGSLQMLDACSGMAPAAAQAISAVLRRVEPALAENLCGCRDTGLPADVRGASHPLGETYYSQLPFLHGEYMAKLAVVPVSPELTALAQAPLPFEHRADCVRDELESFFSVHGGLWELRTQLCTDLHSMPITTACSHWPESQSPYVSVARIVIPAQPALDELRADAIDQALCFDPWRGLAAHRPLGPVNRLRKRAYEMLGEIDRSGHAAAPADVAVGDALATRAPGLQGGSVSCRGAGLHFLSDRQE